MITYDTNLTEHNDRKNYLSIYVFLENNIKKEVERDLISFFASIGIENVKCEIEDIEVDKTVKIRQKIENKIFTSVYKIVALSYDTTLIVTLEFIKHERRKYDSH